MNITNVRDGIYHVEAECGSEAVADAVRARHADATATPYDDVEVVEIGEKGGEYLLRAETDEEMGIEVFVATRQYGAATAHAFTAHMRLCEAVAEVTDRYAHPPSDDIQAWNHRATDGMEEWEYTTAINEPGTSDAVYYIHRFEL